ARPRAGARASRTRDRSRAGRCAVSELASWTPLVRAAWSRRSLPWCWQCTRTRSRQEFIMAPSDPSPDEAPWEKLLRSVFGPDADEAIEQLKARGMDLDALNAAAGIADNPAMMDQVLSQVRSLLGSGNAPVNSDVAHDIARQVVAGEGDPSITRADVRAVSEALSVADLWLDTATELPPAGGLRLAWSRSEWVERTLPAWNVLAAPVAENLVAAL